MSVEGDQLVYEYLTRVSDAASAWLSPTRRVEFVHELRERIESECKAARFGGGELDAAAVRRILDRIGSPEVVVAAEIRRAPRETLRQSRNAPEASSDDDTAVVLPAPITAEAIAAARNLAKTPDDRIAAAATAQDLPRVDPVRTDSPATPGASPVPGPAARGEAAPDGPASDPAGPVHRVVSEHPDALHWSIARPRSPWQQVRQAGGRYLSRYLSLEGAAIVILAVAPLLLSWIGWVVGLLVASTSRLWTSRDRLIGLFWVPVVVATCYVTAWWLHVTGRVGGQRLSDREMLAAAWHFLATMPVALGLLTAAAFAWRHYRR